MSVGCTAPVVDRSIATRKQYKLDPTNPEPKPYRFRLLWRNGICQSDDVDKIILKHACSPDVIVRYVSQNDSRTQYVYVLPLNETSAKHLYRAMIKHDPWK